MKGLQNFKNNVLKNKAHYVTSDYKTRNNSRKNHKGIDLVSHNGKNTTTDYVKKKKKGVVTISTYSSTAGYYVAIKHENGYTTRYLHMKKGTLKVSKGDTVEKGQVLGYMGNTGNSQGAHLHFDVNNGKDYVDPLPYLEGILNFKKEVEPIDEVYIVKKGDTLSEIAEKYNTTYQELAEYNNISNPDMIYVGQEIKIPSNSEKEEIIYIVKKGDTLSEIAKKYNTTVDKLVKDNNISNPNLIYTGQEIIIRN